MFSRSNARTQFSLRPKILGLLVSLATTACNLGGVGVTANTSTSFAGLRSIDQVTSSSVRLVWTPHPGAIRYVAYDVTGATPVVVATIDGALTTYVVPNLAPATGYKFRIRAVDAATATDVNVVDLAVTTLPPGPVLGFYQGPLPRGPGATAATAAWLGRQMPLVNDGVEFNQGWGTGVDPGLISSGDVLASGWSVTSLDLAIQIPMLVNGGPTLAACAHGDYETYHAQLAQRLIARGYGAKILRVGPEFNGTWYPWSAAADPTNWIACYRRVVAIFRAQPGANFRFDWTTTFGQNAIAPDLVYPGDDVVDIIGVDLYNKTYWGALAATRWAHYVGDAFGLQWHADFAALHQKRMSYPEWATGISGHETVAGAAADGSPAGAAGDDAYFVRQMAAWIKTHDVQYHGYWSANPPFDYQAALAPSSTYPAGRFPQAAAAFLAAFGGPDSTSGLPAAAVTSVLVGAITDASFTVSWITPLGGGAVRQYVVRYKPVGAAAWNYADAYLSPATASTTITNLAAGTNYVVEVIASNPAGNGAPVQATALTTGTAAAPASPTALTLVDTYPDSVLLRWTPGTGGGAPTGYVIRYRTTGIPIDDAANGPDTRRLLTGLANATAHDLSVIAINSTGTSSLSNLLNATTLAAPAVGAPLAMSALDTFGPASATGVQLNWSENRGGPASTSFLVRYRVSGASSWTVKGSTAANFYYVGGLNPSTAYEFQTLGITAAGTGPANIIYAATTLAPGAVPPGPLVNLRLDAAHSRSLDVAWGAPTTLGVAAAYRVQYRLHGATSWITAADVTSTTATIPGLTSLTDYDVRVFGTNAAGSGPDSTLLATTAAITSPPDALANVQNGLITVDSIDVNWTASGSGELPTSFLVEYRENSATVWITYATVTTAGTTINGLASNTFYAIRVTPQNSVGPGPGTVITANTWF